MAKEKGKGKGNGADLTIAVLRGIRQDLGALRSTVGEVVEGQRDLGAKVDVLISGQHELATNVSKLNVAMVRVIDEVRALRDERMHEIEQRLARVEKHVGLE